MISAERKAAVRWKGDLESGEGEVTLGTGALPRFPVSWPARVEESGGKTSPEELIAAAHASCFSMALSAELKKAGFEPRSLSVEAVCLIDDSGEGLSIKSMNLSVRGRAGGADKEAFARAAEAAKDGCPVSKALKGNLEIGVRAELED
jgi:osmotically inducible protein OsmC